MSQITTHVLDTAKGQPAAGIPITLHQSTGKDQWVKIANGVTNEDGRITNLIPVAQKLAPGIYRILFETKNYFNSQKVNAFYPYVQVVFEIFDTEHYHVPLLLNPFGYTTYRGT